MNNNLFKSYHVRAVATVSPKLLKIRFVLYNISLFISTRYLYVAMRYLDVTKGVG